MQSPREIRRAKHVSQLTVAARSQTSLPLVRLYEANPSAVSHDGKRAALDEVYADLACGQSDSTAPPAAAR